MLSDGFLGKSGAIGESLSVGQLLVFDLGEMGVVGIRRNGLDATLPKSQTGRTPMSIAGWSSQVSEQRGKWVFR